jgi:DNA-binding CsgD family transcriptional regulator
MKLTPTEIKIAELVKKAKRNKEIADITRISEGTVRTHLRSIFKKLKIKSRTELIIKELQK